MDAGVCSLTPLKTSSVGHLVKKSLPPRMPEPTVLRIRIEKKKNARMAPLHFDKFVLGYEICRPTKIETFPIIPLPFFASGRYPLVIKLGSLGGTP